MTKKIKGLTLKQLNNAIFGVEKLGLDKNKTPARVVKKEKPERIFRNKQKHDLGLLLNTTYSTSQVVSECPVPSWFKFIDKADVSVVVPLYKNSIENLVETWDFFNEGLKAELIFVDDNCPNNSGNMVLSSWQNRIEEIKKPIGKILRSATTQGWGACCNAGALHATGKIIVFLNPDMKLFPGWLNNLIKTLRKPDVGCVGGLIVNEQNDTIEESGREWNWEENKFLKIGSVVYRGKRISSPFKMDNVPADIFQASEREFISSDFMAIKREDFLNWGGFSPVTFQQDWSDADFCMSVLEKNKKIIYQPNARVYKNKTKTNGTIKSKTDEALFYNKWIISNRLNCLIKNKTDEKKQILNILVKRQAAHGDVLVAAALAPALKKKYPEAQIVYATDCPEVLQNNPWIDKVVSECSERQFHLFLNLDMVYEYRPTTNFLEAYADFVGVNVKDCSLYLHNDDSLNFELPKEYVVMHVSNNTWVGRNWSNIKFDQISNRLQKRGAKIVCVGTNDDHKPTCCDCDLRGKTSIAQLATVIKNCSCFIGVDSFPMWVAEVFKIKGAVFFGSISPNTRLINKTIIPVLADGLKCLGCHHRKQTPCVATTTCEVGVQECSIGVSVDRMWKAIEQILQNNN